MTADRTAGSVAVCKAKAKIKFESPRSLSFHFEVIPGGLTFPALKFWMLIKFDSSSKTGVLVVKFAFATASLKIENLRMRRPFCTRVLGRFVFPIQIT